MAIFAGPRLSIHGFRIWAILLISWYGAWRVLWPTGIHEKRYPTLPPARCNGSEPHLSPSLAREAFDAYFGPSVATAGHALMRWGRSTLEGILTGERMGPAAMSATGFPARAKRATTRQVFEDANEGGT